VRKKIWRHTKKRDSTLEESEQEITMQEMERVINEMNNNKAPGQDDIPYEFIRHLGPRAKGMLLHLYRKCWSGEGLPTKWRTSTIMPHLKEDKDPKKTVSYRPISLTSCLGKILEKIIADRLISILESGHLLSDNQAGFRRNRCTTDQVLKLVQEASDQIHGGKETYRTVTAFFDYEKAYDKVWRDGLLSKMIDLNIPPRFIRYVRHFLSGRSTVVEVNGAKSRPFILKEGLPQGSSISPLLFLIFINDIDVDLDASTFASLFADDTSVWRSGGARQEGDTVGRTGEELRQMDRELMQEEVDKIMSWASKWKMKVNTGKTKSMVISSATADRKWDPELEADSMPILPVQEYPFLGVTVNNDLRFKAHVDKVVTKSKKRVNVLKCMSSKDWGNSLETQRTLYIQYVRSGLEYSSPTWTSWISDSVLQKVQRVQNEALRSVGCLAKTCPVDLLHLETGVEPLADRFAKNNQLLWERYRRLPEEDPRRVLLEKSVTTRLKTRIGWRNTTEPLMEDLEFECFGQIPDIPPWREIGMEFDEVVLDRKKDEYSEEELRTRAEAKINELFAEVIIYTDGSTNQHQENGGAGIFIEDSRTNETFEASFPAGRLSSSYGAEGVALMKAIEWISENECTSVICTDSMSLHQALKNNNWKDNNELISIIKDQLQHVNNKPTLLWVPSHCGLAGNEKADELANLGSKMSQENVPVAHAIVKARIKRSKWNVSHNRGKEMYLDRRAPRVDIERKWPRKVRRLFARLRTDHAKELRFYMYLIEKEDDPSCVGCGFEKETIKHILCDCPALSIQRARHAEGEVTIDHMVSKPEVCRRILETRFPDLAIRKTHTNHVEDGENVRRTLRPQREPGVALA